jgi:glycosyltransferase involved in cell wall biosynthesis
LKVAILYPWLTYFGGACRVIISLSKHFNAKIYTGFYNPEKTYSEIEDLTVVEYKSIFKDGKMRNYEGAARSLGLDLDEFDVINPHLFPCTLVSLKYRNTVWYCHTPMQAFYHHRHFFLRRYKLLYSHHVPLICLDQLAARRTSKIVCNSLVVKERIKKFYNKKAAVIYPGIDLKKYSNRGFENFFLCIGALDEYKRLNLAVDAFRHLKEYDLYVISGRDTTGGEKMWSYLKKNAPPNVQFLRNLEDHELIDLYSRCTAIIHPAYGEDFGLVPIEAMASGKPVIACRDGGGVTETVVNGKTGFLTKPNPRDVALSVKKLNDKQVLKEMSEACLERSLSFSEQSFLEKMAAVYEEVSRI